MGWALFQMLVGSFQALGSALGVFLFHSDSPRTKCLSTLECIQLDVFVNVDLKMVEAELLCFIGFCFFCCKSWD